MRYILETERNYYFPVLFVLPIYIIFTLSIYLFIRLVYKNVFNHKLPQRAKYGILSQKIKFNLRRDTRKNFL